MLVFLDPALDYYARLQIYTFAPRFHSTLVRALFNNRLCLGMFGWILSPHSCKAISFFPAYAFLKTPLNTLNMQPSKILTFIFSGLVVSDVDYYFFHCRNQSADYRSLDKLPTTDMPITIAHPNVFYTNPKQVPF